jgi:hypothetical protein
MSNRSFATWIVDRPGPAVLVTGLLGLLPLLGLGFAFFLPGAVPALVVLMRGARAGALVAAGASLLLASVVWFVGRPLPVGLIYATWVLGPPLALAVLFRRTESRSMALQGAVLLGVVLLLMLHLTLGDPEQFWAPLVRDLAAEMQRRGLPMNLEQDQFVETLSRTLWGWVTVLTVLLAMCALFLARWWQSRNGQPGRFGAEFQQLRLGLALGTVAAVTIVVSLLIDRPLAGDLARLFLGALLIVGLAAAHRFKATGRLAGAWLWLIYVLLVLAAPIMVAVLAGWGFIDNWLRSNRPARPENAN